MNNRLGCTLLCMYDGLYGVSMWESVAWVASTTDHLLISAIGLYWFPIYLPLSKLLILNFGLLQLRNAMVHFVVALMDFTKSSPVWWWRP